ncbi:spore coat protein CotJB [Mesobacillus selenatarsenatis]|jgi:spore coat protein JB|uniref:Polypeptide composition of the spore coat protein CotJB n=1 Tax=Mesobacillus selenatarsenatis (strain DSM 18680 / JCM 14380 / FERM P-15431 / SF-1) TaxID=1321606 RepID=A0A0A8X1M5_MESS1|nr:spore coat protein CotJB [Mesobacillus selenatarsenatis]GAM13880.1 polypeptide composition of the spore coat protein CotJB [Mesobacillus selenatarsenatis SF-1]
MKQLPKEFYAAMEELQAVDFVLVDLTLYLDTHPEDYDAINQFNQFAKERRRLKKVVESMYGPLQQFGNSYSGYPWNWDDGPWPWQI